MRILVISDIHANSVALESVLSDADGSYDQIWCLGDVVGYGPSPNECVQMIREQATICVMGNHDSAVLGRPGVDVDDFNPMARQAVMWTRDELSEENRLYLDALPDQPVEPTDEGDVLVTHASPREPVWEYILTPTIALENFTLFSQSLCFVGHTHKPAIYRWQLALSTEESTRPAVSGNVTVDHLVPPQDGILHLNGISLADGIHHQRLIINPGSVGQPRDNDPRAAYGLLDLDEMTWVQKRVAYPIDLTQGRMRAANLPRRLIDRLNYGW